MKTNHIKLIAAMLPMAAVLLTNVASSARANVIAYWRMEAQAPTTCWNTPGVVDEATASGQGTQASGCTPAAADDPLITFNANGDTVAISSSVPPAGMFSPGFSGGVGSYDSEAILNKNGALFFAVDRYGDEFTTAFWTVEFFFKANGDQSGNGFQMLFKNDEVNDHYGMVLNEPGPGSLRLYVFDGSSWPSVDLTDRNYADGQWHYVVCSYDTVNNKLTLRVRSEDGKVSRNFRFLSTDPVSGNAGNLFIGRRAFNNDSDPRTFRGLIDEMRISDNVVPDGELIGKITPDGTHVVGHWRFESILDWGSATNWARFEDYAAGSNEGTSLGGGGATPSQDYLNIWPGDTGAAIASTVPPSGMFKPGFGGGANSYDVKNSSSTAVFVPDRFGDELNTASWTIELFYKSDGNQAGSNTDEGNRMQLLRNGDWFYGLVANESTAGGLRLFAHAVNDSWWSSDLNDRNYSDGSWQYIVCSYDQPTRQLTLRVRSENGLVSSSSVTLSADPITTPQPLFFGAVDANGSRRVRGWMDEIRFSDNVQPDSALMGLINADSTTAASSSLNPAYRDSVVTLTATVSAANTGNGTPTGTVQFKIDGSAVGSPVTLTGGQATLDADPLAMGSHTITAEYSGDNKFYSSTTSFTQVINNRPPVAQNTSYNRTEGLGIKLKISNLLALCSDADNDTISFVGVDSGTNSATVSTDATYVFYTPADNLVDLLTYTVSDGNGGTAQGQIVINVVKAVGTPPQITVVDGVLTIRFAGIPDYPYVVQRAPTLDFSNPEVVLTTNAPGAGVFIFTDPSPLQPTSFYRLAQP